MAETKATSAGQPSRQEEQQEKGGAMQGRGQMMHRAAADVPSPIDLMRRVTEEMDRVFGDFGFAPRWLMPRSVFRALPSIREAAWTPRIEAFQQEDRFIIRAELPGLSKDDVEVNLTDDAAIIQGQRKQEREEEREGYYHSERSYGTFYRAIPLPEGVIPDSAEASFKDGVLEIRLQAPPHEVSKGRRLEIKAEGEQGKQK